MTSGERGSSDEESERRTDGGEVDGGDEDDIPLNIAGHDDRTPPGEARGETTLEFSEGTSVERGDSGGEGEDEDEDEDEDDDIEPVELLVQLAKNGEIDPWDIDIVHVTDRFLEVLDEADLRTSGRALFYASVLLRMKSDELFAVDEPDEEELPPWEAPFADDGAMAGEGGDGEGAVPGFDPVENLESEMERRLERKQARGKPETLDELVRELRDAERGTWWKESRTYDTSESPQGFSRGMQELSYHSGDDYRVDDEPTADDVTHTAHEEDIEAVIDDVEAELEDHYEKGREEVLYAEIELAGGTRVMTYLALLFLSHRGSVRLEQDELFGDLWVQQVTVETEPTEAIAD
ncbi:segregation/condensation protein A [Halomontanus rarus]|uniref:segregation/condensation protein A n=1 Tax=Halomontanus rarus TaxID=3034020 RepID=UPI001A982C10